MRKYLFAAGKYWIGDPCYAVKDDNWMPLLERTEYLHNGDFTYNGKECFTSSTKYGDGCYTDNLGHRYGVDAGLLSIMPLDACDGDDMGSGHIFTFENEFVVSAEDGYFDFGHIHINTGDEPDQDFDEENEEDGYLGWRNDHLTSDEEE